MVSSSKRLPTTVDALVTNRRIGNDLYGLNRLRNTTRTIQPPPRSGAPSQGSSSSSSGTGLKTVGDSMVGPIAFFPVDATMTDDAIDISASGNSPSDFSTNVRLLPEGGVDDDLLTIFGAAFDGQLLYLQGAPNLTVTILGATAGNGGNIISTEEFFIIGNQIVTLLFDMSADTGDAAVEGAWRIVAGGSGTQDALLVARLSADYPLIGQIPWDLSFPLGDPARIIVTATDGVYEIIDGLFQLESTLGVEMSEAGGGSEAFALWQSAQAETGPWTDIANNSTVISTFSTGRPTFTVQPTCSVLADARDTSLFVRVETTLVSGIFINVLNLSSFANIEFINPSSGGGGGSVGGSLGDLSDVTLTGVQTDDHLVFDGAEWTNQPASLASQTPWVSNIDGDGFNLDFNQNVTRPAPAITNLKNIQLGIWSGSVFPKGTINVEPDRFELNITDPSDDFFIKSNQDQKFGYLANTNRMQSFVDLDMNIQKILNANGISFAGDGVSIANTPQVFYNDTEDAMHFDVRPNGFWRWQETGSLDIMRLSPIDIQGVPVGDLQNVARIRIYNQTLGLISPALNGDIQVVGPDVIITSGGAQKNISDIGTGGGSSDRIISPDTNTNVIANDGSVTTQVDGFIKSTLDASVYTIGVPLNLGSQGIQSVNFITPNNSSAVLGNSSNFFGSIFTSFAFFGNTVNSIFGDNGGLDFDVGSGNDFKFSAANQLLQIGPSSVAITNGILTMGGNLIRDIALLPLVDSDAASKKYVDDNAGGTLDGTIEAALWTDGETTQFDFFTYHSNSNNNGGISQISMPEDIMFWVPFFVGKAVRIFRMAARIPSSGVGTYNLAFGIYSNRTDGQNYPQTLVDTTNSFFSGAGIKTVLMGTQILPAGLYWLAVVCTTNSDQVINAYDDGNCISVGWVENGNDFDPMTGYISGQSSTALPSTAPNEMTTLLRSFGATPAIYARFIPV